jgi:hypothetical protein
VAAADPGAFGVGKRTLTQALPMLPAPGGGAKLPDTLRAKMEQALGADFSDVRVHASSQAATELGAQAFARGSDLHFAPGTYDPESSTGQELIGHELAHVIQQRAGAAADPMGDGDGVARDPALESEADAAGAAAARGETARISGADGAGGAPAPAPGGARPAQARFVQSGAPLPSNAARWENVGDGNAPTGVYTRHPAIVNRWTRQGTDEQYVFEADRLERADDHIIDMSGGTESDYVVIDIDSLARQPPPRQPQPQPHAQPVAPTPATPAPSSAPSSVGASSSSSSSGGVRKQLPALDSVARPDLTLVQSLASTLFSEEALKDGYVRDLILRVLGDGFVQWAASGAKIDEGALQSNADQICLDKLAELQKRYPAITLIDVIVISAYSWYADSYVRIEGAKQSFKDFGLWQTFAEQLIASLRKLRRFTGDTLYRCARPGHEAENLKTGGTWNAGSFLSSTYSDEARASLEEDPKYAHGSTLCMDARNVEGYHMEEFSRFEKEYEVVLLPGHTVQGHAPTPSPSSAPSTSSSSSKPSSKVGERPRDVNVSLVPPAYARPRTGAEPDSTAEFESLHKNQYKSLPPPPMMRPPQKLSEEALVPIRQEADRLYRAAVDFYPLSERTMETLRPAASELATFLKANGQHLEPHLVEEYQEFLQAVARAYAPVDQAAEREVTQQREATAADFLAEESGGLALPAELLAGTGLADQLARRANAYLWHLPTRELRDELRVWFDARYANGTRLPADQPDSPGLRLAHFLAERDPTRARFIELRQRHLAQRGGERGVVIRAPH